MRTAQRVWWPTGITPVAIFLPSYFGRLECLLRHLAGKPTVDTGYAAENTEFKDDCI